MPDTTRPSQLKSRLILLLIVAMFFSSFFIAWGLRFAGWVPSGHKNFGELIQPPKNLSQAKFLFANGDAYSWQAEQHIWRIVVVPSVNCQSRCVTLLDTLMRVWESQGRQAERVDVLWFGKLPANSPNFRKLFVMQASPALEAALTQTSAGDAIPVYLMDPNGFLVMHYLPDFDPSGLRKDLARLLK